MWSLSSTAWLGLALLVGATLLVVIVRLRNMQYWVGSYLAGWPARRRQRHGLRRVYVCVADHFEPFGGGVERGRGEARLQRWLTTYPQIAARHRDSSGKPPIHTFFYPLEDYDAVTLDQLAGLCQRGFADVEVHYHHDNDSAEKLAVALDQFKRALHQRHRLLRTEEPGGQIVYCFIHGNWALDNSRPDGRWCGVDNELSVLVETGCVADFTMPSAPSDTQTAKINSIYFARGRPGRRKSHDKGRDAAVGQWRCDGELLLVQGPLGLNWQSRKFGIIPRIENGEISADAPPSERRIRLWERLAPRVRGAEQHLFIKLHTHGAQEATMDTLLGGGLEAMWSGLEREFRDQPGCQLHYVSAWQMYCLIRDLANGRVPAPD